MSIGHAPRYDFTNQTVGAVMPEAYGGDNKTRVRADRARSEAVTLRNYKQGSRARASFKFTTTEGGREENGSGIVVSQRLHLIAN